MTQIKIVIASQARVIHLYKEIKHKILKCNANIQFKKECVKFDLTQNYANIKVNNTSPGSKFKQHKIGRDDPN
jgi:hypothetical protein